MVELSIIVIAALVMLGLVFGSFVNALVWRFHEQDEVRDQIETLREQPGSASKGKAGKARQAKLEALEARLAALSMSKGRSMCSACSHPLAAKDLVPLFSWLWLRGKCRYCRQPIPDTPWLEAGLPATYVLSYVYWPMPFEGYGLLAAGLWLVFLTGFAALLVYDLRWFLLPDRIVWPLAGLAAVQVLLHAAVYDGGMAAVITALWGVATASGIFLILYVVSQGRWIGFGDVKLGIVLGLLVGGPLQGLLVIFLASLLGTLASLPVLLSRRLRKDSIIPFGPFLIIAACILVLFGQGLSDLLYDYLALS